MDLPSELPFPRLLTVGHSNHKPEPFLKLLHKFNVKELVDVRSIPSSGKFPHFKKHALQKLLESDGIGYRHCPELGNKGVEGGILGLLQLPQGQAAVQQLAQTGQEATLLGPKCAFMCAEADWRECHRQVVAQRLFLDHGITVNHIKRDGTLEPHPADHVLPDYFQAPAVPKAPLQGYQGPLSIAGANSAGDAQENDLRPEEAAAPAQAPVKPRRWGRKKEGTAQGAEIPLAPATPVVSPDPVSEPGEATVTKLQ